MTWGAQIVRGDGTPSQKNQHVCPECRHGVPGPDHRVPCSVTKLGAWAIGNVLTSVDVGADGHMASGTAVLKCNGFEALEG